MGIIIRWTETATCTAELAISDEELAAWAVANLPLRTLQRTSTVSVAPDADQLAQSLRTNSHLRATIVRFYAEAAATLRTEHRTISPMGTLSQTDSPTNTATATPTDTAIARGET